MTRGAAVATGVAWSSGDHHVLQKKIACHDGGDGVTWRGKAMHAPNHPPRSALRAAPTAAVAVLPQIGRLRAAAAAAAAAAAPAVMSTQGFECDASHPLIGSGAFAKVLRVRERSTGRSFAVKVMERRFFEVRGIGRLIDQEIAALRRCADHDRCRHVVQLLGVAEEAGHVYLRFELCRSTVLHVVQNRPGCRVAEHEAAVWASQLLTGLGHLHALGILHRDIKPDNLLISMDGTLKVADFGWCAELSDRPTDLAGTFRYMAPEVMARETQTEAVDAWSFGATFLELVTGQPLLSSLPGTGSKGPVLTPLQREVAERCPPLRSSRPPFLSQSCWEVFRSALEPVVSHRISVIAAQQLPWLEAFAASSAASTRAPADAASEDDASSATPPVAPFVQCDDNVWRARGGAPPLTPPAAPVTASASTPSGAEDAAGTRRAPGSAAASPRSWLVLPPPEKCDDLGCPSDRSTATPTPSEPENDTAAADPLRRCASVGPAVMGVTVVTEAPRETPIELDSAPRTPQILHVVLPREPCIRWPPQGVQGAPLVGARAAGWGGDRIPGSACAVSSALAVRGPGAHCLERAARTFVCVVMQRPALSERPRNHPSRVAFLRPGVLLRLRRYADADALRRSGGSFCAVMYAPRCWSGRETTPVASPLWCVAAPIQMRCGAAMAPFLRVLGIACSGFARWTPRCQHSHPASAEHRAGELRTASWARRGRRRFSTDFLTGREARHVTRPRPPFGKLQRNRNGAALLPRVAYR
eukprot:CAMPEP_0117502796 /NCGR_PEP_ID=MMETSP0784-20121206/23996_1 /TAXON_ID=39447 /ORGANISM="" /LENGTH=757 /DNA_ID=CAMNT_0005298087 /DNA_START=24 /DNA_END=2295 /DNA_ORIENTATION=-